MSNILKVNSFQESLNMGYCGPASLKMVLEYYGIKKNENELAKLCDSDSDVGTTSMSIKRAAESFGLKVIIKDYCEFEDIEYYLNSKIPLIVDWFTRGRKDYGDEEVPDGHYSVVVGLDNKYIYLQDSEIGKLRKLNRDDFFRVWFDFQGLFINDFEDMIIREIIAIYK